MWFERRNKEVGVSERPVSGSVVCIVKREMIGEGLNVLRVNSRTEKVGC